MAGSLGFGLLGGGLIAPYHASSIKGAEGADLVAVCDSNPERATQLAKRYGARPYLALDEMLADDRVSAVSVLLPSGKHHEAAIQCAQAGRHVLVEEPPALALAELDAMVAACRDAGVKLGCAMQYRVRMAAQCIKRAVDQGRFGKLLQVEAHAKSFRSTDYYQSGAWRGDRSSGAGATFQYAFHYIDLLQHLCGPVTTVQAQMRNVAHPAVDIEDTVTALLTFENGASGIVQASTGMWPGTGDRIEINGRNGAAMMAGKRIAGWRFKEEKPEDDTVRRIGKPVPGTKPAAGAEYNDHKVLIQDFINAVRQNRDPAVSVESVRHTLEIVLGLYQSAAYGGPVILPVKDDPSIWG